MSVEKLVPVQREMRDSFERHAHGQPAHNAAWAFVEKYDSTPDDAFQFWICSGCKRIRYVRSKHVCNGTWQRWLAVPA